MSVLYIVMPAYNEADNIERTVKEWYPVLEGKDTRSRLVVADGGSTDNTHQILEAMKKDHPQLEILSGTRKEHGPKVIALYKYAIRQSGGQATYFKPIRTDRQIRMSSGHSGTREGSMILSWDTGGSEVTESKERS